MRVEWVWVIIVIAGLLGSGCSQKIALKEDTDIITPPSALPPVEARMTEDLPSEMIPNPIAEESSAGQRMNHDPQQAPSTDNAMGTPITPPAKAVKEPTKHPLPEHAKVVVPAN